MMLSEETNFFVLVVVKVLVSEVGEPLMVLLMSRLQLSNFLGVESVLKSVGFSTHFLKMSDLSSVSLVEESNSSGISILEESDLVDVLVLDSSNLFCEHSGLLLVSSNSVVNIE